MSNKVYIAASLDGFIADRNGSIDWLHEIPNPTGSDYGFADFLDGVDALVMGRKTYEKVLSFDCDWPYSKKVFVLNNTLKQVDPSLAGKAELISGDFEEIVDQLRKNGFKNLYIDGGKTIQGFLEQGLIDEITITRIPIILGGGTPLFDTLPHPIRLKHCSTEELDGGMVKSHYKIETP